MWSSYSSPRTGRASSSRSMACSTTPTQPGRRRPGSTRRELVRTGGSTSSRVTTSTVSAVTSLLVRMLPPCCTRCSASCSHGTSGPALEAVRAAQAVSPSGRVLEVRDAGVLRCTRLTSSRDISAMPSMSFLISSQIARTASTPWLAGPSSCPSRLRPCAWRLVFRPATPPTTSVRRYGVSVWCRVSPAGGGRARDATPIRQPAGGS